MHDVLQQINEHISHIHFQYWITCQKPIYLFVNVFFVQTIYMLISILLDYPLVASGTTASRAMTFTLLMTQS